jgi:hypothetical protein
METLMRSHHAQMDIETTPANQAARRGGGLPIRALLFPISWLDNGLGIVRIDVYINARMAVHPRES